MLAKAPSLGADEAIVDLEDAVAPEDKAAARELAVAALRRGALARTTAIRVNARGSEWWEDDLRAAVEAQIETASGLANADEIAAAGDGLEALVFGPADLAASLSIPVLTIGDGTNDYAFARVVAAARACGLQPIDGPHARLGDDLGLVVSARRAFEHGYDGKWVIHPSQIGPVHLVFTPSPAEVERAERILAAPQGAVRFEGELVDEASRRLAESLLSRAALLS